MRLIVFFFAQFTFNSTIWEGLFWLGGIFFRCIGNTYTVVFLVWIIFKFVEMTVDKRRQRAILDFKKALIQQTIPLKIYWIKSRYTGIYYICVKKSTNEHTFDKFLSACWVFWEILEAWFNNSSLETTSLCSFPELSLMATSSSSSFSSRKKSIAVESGRN